METLERWYPFVLIACGVASVQMAVLLFVRRRRAVYARAGALLYLASALWALGYAAELHARSWSLTLFWAKLQYLGIIPLPLLWWLVARSYSGRSTTLRQLALVAGPAQVFLILALTANRHELIWSSYDFRQTEFVSYVYEGSNGPALWAFAVYAYSLTGLGIYYLAHLRERSHEFFTRRLALLILVCVISASAGLHDLLQLPPLPELDLTPPAIGISSLLVGGFLIFWHHDIVPLARSMVLESMNDAVLVVNAQQRIVDLNPIASRLMGRPDRELLGVRLTEAWPEVARLVAEQGSGRSGSAVLRVNGRAQEPRAYDLRVSPIQARDGAVLGQVIVLRDISERVRAEERLRHEALHDALTGLPNRNLLMDRLEQALRRARRHADYGFAVLFMDLDRFKVVNDSLGHSVGDELLVQVARRLRECLRQVDTVARLGGDEFVVVLDQIAHPQEAVQAAERIREALCAPFQVNGHEVHTSASIGIALGDANYARSEDLLRNADIAMYRAKALGRDRHVVFDTAMHARAMAMWHLENDLRQALERQQFRLYYQPVVRLHDGLITGFEALLRWEHPVRGLLEPVEFLPLAEETGLVVPLGNWVLKEACGQMSDWTRRQPALRDLTISVNLSRQQLLQPELVSLVKATLEETGLEPPRLHLEVTEQVMLEDTFPARQAIQDLRALGVAVHIDDFGIGYSSLSVFHRFPVDVIKIDRTFVQRMDNGRQEREIVRIMLALAQALRIQVIAEGIETQEQLEMLQNLDCAYGQGFLFQTPGPPEHLEPWLLNAGEPLHATGWPARPSHPGAHHESSSRRV